MSQNRLYCQQRLACVQQQRGTAVAQLWRSWCSRTRTPPRSSYVRNNQINLIDPTGHRFCEFDGYCEPPTPSNNLTSGIATVTLPNRRLQRFGVTQISFDIPIHIDPDPMNPELFNYEIAANSLMNEHNALHPTTPLYKSYPEWQAYFEKYGILDAIGIVQAMVNRQADDTSINLYKDEIQQLDGIQFDYSDKVWDRGGETYQDFLLISYVVVELGEISDLLNGRSNYFHYDADTNIRNDPAVYLDYPNNCCLDRVNFAYVWGIWDLTLVPKAIRK